MFLEDFDILVTVNDGHDPYHALKRWLMGPYDHVAMYLGPMYLRAQAVREQTPTLFPAVFESIKRGVIIRDLRSWGPNKRVVVMRIPVLRLAEIEAGLAQKAVDLASESGSVYDYPAIFRWAIPRIILEKLNVEDCRRWRNDKRHLCSEAVYNLVEPFYDILPDTMIPLPGDYVENGYLYNICEGYLVVQPRTLVPWVSF
jgi:hypothetical protein